VSYHYARAGPVTGGTERVSGAAGLIRSRPRTLEQLHLPEQPR
jgi:hypothetical protein